MNGKIRREGWTSLATTAVVAVALPLVWELAYLFSPWPSAGLDLPTTIAGVAIGGVWLVWRLGWWALAANVVYGPAMFYLVAGFALALGEWNAFHALRSAVWRYVGVFGS